MAPPSTPEKYPTKEMYDSELIKIEVGQYSIKTFTAHKGIICFYSGFFDKTFNGGFEEAKTGVVKLPEEAVSDVNLFIMWIYSRRLESDQSSKLFSQLCSLWLFADRREVPLLANMCMNRIKDKMVKHSILPSAMLNTIYNNTVKGSGLRRFLAFTFARVGYNCSGEVEQTRFPAEALWDIVNLQWEAAKKQQLFMSTVELGKMKLCEYHEHEEGVSCDKPVPG